MSCDFNTCGCHTITGEVIAPETIKLTITDEHRNKAFKAYLGDRKSLARCCLIYQALAEKYPELSIWVSCSYASVCFKAYDLDDKGKYIAGLFSSEWKNLELPVTVELTLCEGES